MDRVALRIGQKQTGARTDKKIKMNCACELKTYSIGHQGTESVGCGNANESHCKTLFGLPAQLNSQRLKSAN